VWESHFASAAAEGGRAITEAIWHDMTQSAGYIAHELLEDLDDPATSSSSINERHASAATRSCASTPTTPTGRLASTRPTRRPHPRLANLKTVIHGDESPALGLTLYFGNRGLEQPP
jgi:hypothetical protein